MAIEIKFKYLEIDGMKWKTREFTAEEYFDPTAPRVSKEGYRADSLPEHYDELRYLGLKASQVLKCIVSIEDSERDEETVFSFTYWNEGKNRLVERTMNFGEEKWMLLLSNEVPVLNEVSMNYLRVVRNSEGVLRVVGNSIEAENGSNKSFQYGEKASEIPEM